MPKIYQANAASLNRPGNLFQNDFPGLGGRFKFVPRIRRCSVLTHGAAVFVSGWDEVLKGRRLEIVSMAGITARPDGSVPVTDYFSAIFPSLTSCLCCCYFYLKPHLDVVDSLSVHHANCGAIKYGPDDPKMNINKTNLDRVRVLVGVPQSDLRQYESGLSKITASGVSDNNVHL